MASFPDALRSGLRRAYCSQVRQSPTWFSNLREVLVGGDLLRRGDALNRWVCGTDPDEPPPIEPPFTGGQCPGVSYLVTVTGTASPTQSGNATRIVDGPVGGVCFGAPTPTGVLPIGVSGANGCITSGGGIGNTQVASQGTWQITNIEPRFGAIDNCGDPPLDLPPPGPVEVPVDITYEGDDNTNFNLTVPVIFAPVYVALDGSINIPIRIPAINLTGNINLENNFEFTPDFGPESGPGETDGDEPPNDPDSTDPVEPPSEESPATIIGVEVFCQVSADAPASSIIFDNAPNIFAPRLGSVSFAIRTPSSIVWTADESIKNKEMYIPCPAPQGAVAVRATPAPGVTVRWNAIRSRPLLQID